MKQNMILKTKNILVNCNECGTNTKIPISKFYDAFDGIFICESCGNALDPANDALDDE